MRVRTSKVSEEKLSPSPTISSVSSKSVTDGKLISSPKGTATCCIACILGSVGDFFPPLKKETYINTDVDPKQLKGTLHSNRTDKTHYNRPKYTNLGFLVAGPSCETSPLLLLGVDLDFGFGDEDRSGRDTSASPSFAATTCAFCREICSCDIVRAEGVQLMCDYSGAIHSQAQCMGLKYIQSSNSLTAQLSSSSRPLLCFFIL